MLKITRILQTDNAATLSVEDTGVVSVYRKSPVYVEKLYWRANPRTNDALVSIDVSEVGEILSLELLTYNGVISEALPGKLPASRSECDHLVWVSTEHWHRPAEERNAMKTAWRYVDCDLPVTLSLGKECLRVGIGHAEPRSFLRMSKCLGFGLDENDQIVAFYIDEFGGSTRQAFLKRYRSLMANCRL